MKEEKRKRPWYAWLSLVGFLWLYSTLSAKQMGHKPFDLDRWMRFCGRSVVLFFLLFMLPAMGMTWLCEHFVGRNQPGWDLSLCGMWAVLYLLGVFLTVQLWHWAGKNHLR